MTVTLSAGQALKLWHDANLHMVRDEEPDLLAGGPGLSLERSEPANSPLLDDLRSDVGMEWVPEEMWFTVRRPWSWR